MEMQTCDFLFTYSIVALDLTNESQELANSIRQKLNKSKISNWNKLDNVETAFSGSLTIKSASTKEMRKDAMLVIKNELRTVVRHFEAGLDVQVYVALMVQGLGETIIFDF